ncbi:glycerol-3-phosphate dehydrogenase 1-like protein [Puma concolor]|uniref:Glycerol-3-phosphate dehydrogenase [NAD(+)] n=1 Tax=Puma concolor TaxID=9696 RepID=A0A6P6H244_PUMCO|nr:glycerol-3-phosphate dehydrogenase 1-like protein [Puma concolor]
MVRARLERECPPRWRPRRWGSRRGGGGGGSCCCYSSGRPGRAWLLQIPGKCLTHTGGRGGGEGELGRKPTGLDAAAAAPPPAAALAPAPPSVLVSSASSERVAGSASPPVVPLPLLSGPGGRSGPGALPGAEPQGGGSAVAKIIGNNVKKLKKFASTVKMWVFEETVNGRKLTDIINNDHENVKYLPGHKLPENVIAVPNLSEAVQDADLLVFVIPHQFIHRICDEITGRVPKKALGITLIKGIDEGPEGLKLISDIIREKMGIDVSVLMGANIASEVAAEKFCETTIGSKIMENGLLFKELLQTPNFRITVVDDADTVELCGALKNIVAVGAGFCDGLHSGDNTKAAVIRLGLMEMIAFAKIFCKGQVSTATFLESCGVADLITTCYGGRNRRVAEAFARTGKTIEELEKDMLNGQKLQGPQTSAEVYRILKQKGLIDKFPLFTAVYQICYEGKPVQEMLSCLQSHPEHV